MSKKRYKVSNWREYNQALIQRGSLTFWFDEQTLKAWHDCLPNGRRGRDCQFSDVAITTALMVQAVFGLSLRQTQGFIDSLFKLMDIPLHSPTYSSISKRAKTLKVHIPKPKGPITDLVFDATGLKLYGEGEWKVHKHGADKRRGFRKLHLAVDGQHHFIISAEMSLESVGDNQVLPSMLNGTKCTIGTVYGDGAYDTRACYQAIARKRAKACIPPRRNAIRWKDEAHPRNQAVAAIQANGIQHWKQDSGYHRRSIGETAMWRYKSQTGDRLRLRTYDAQVSEAMARVAALNKMTTLGMPVSRMVG